MRQIPSLTGCALSGLHSLRSLDLSPLRGLTSKQHLPRAYALQQFNSLVLIHTLVLSRAWVLQTGAQFVTDLAHHTGVELSSVLLDERRSAFWIAFCQRA